MKLKPLDYLSAFLVILFITYYTIDTLKPVGTSSNFYIESNGKKYIYPIDADETLEFNGDIGSTIIEIHNGEAAITQSDCKDKVCIEMGEVKDGGDYAACLPNKIILGIEGSNEEIDGISY